MPQDFAAYAAHGWKLCAIEKGSKGANYHGWQTPEKAEEISAAAEGLEGAGLLHALSGTCALDIDNLEVARKWWAERDVDLGALLTAPEAVRIHSGKHNRAKLLYRLKKPLRSILRKADGFELRCATAKGTSVQDVLPPTIHPETNKPYEWVYGDPLTGDWRNLPTIPVGVYRVWRELIIDTPLEREAGAAPASKKPAAPVKAASPALLEYYVSTRLAKLDPSDYDQWIAGGQAGHAEDPNISGPYFQAWDTWSRKSPKYSSDGANSTRAKWQTFTQGAGRSVRGRMEEPAEKDEFPVEAAASIENAKAAEAVAKVEAKVKRADAQRELEKRLIYVAGSERYFDVRRHKLIGSEGALQHLFTHMMPRKNGSRVDPVKALKESPTKSIVDFLAFHPGEGAVFEQTEGNERVRYANTYRDSLPTPLEPTAAELERIEWLFGRITDSSFRRWLRQFLGHVVQRPGVKIRSAPLLWSETQGNGKTTLLRTIPALLCGAHYSREVNCSLLSSGFNDYVQNAWHINLAEFRAGTRGERNAISEVMKQWIAEESIAVHPKGLPAYTMINRFFVTATSNHADAAQIDNDDRRWAVHEFTAPQMTVEEQEYLFGGLISTPRAAAVLRHYFLHVDLAGFSPTARAPITESRQEMVEASVSSELEAVRNAFEERAGIFARDVVITREVAEFVKHNYGFRPSEHRVGRILARPPFHGVAIRYRVADRKYRAIAVRNHARWAASTGADIQAHLDGDSDSLLA